MAYTTIDDPSVYFQTKLWSGNGSAGTSITNDGNSDLKPDFFWAKVRNHTYNHIVLDSSRGVTNKRIIPNSTDAEDTYAGFMDSFDTDGFTLDNDVNTNESGKTYVAWQWKANGGTRTTFTESGNNPAGGHQANTTAGFSIVDYTGTGALGTIAHGLGVAPTVVFVKGRDDGHAWIVKHSGAGNPVLVLNATDAASSGSSEFNNTAPTSSVFTVNSAGGTNKDGEKYIAYCFAPIQGYSKFGSYTGNNNADGPMVFCGFKPAWLMTKRTDSSDHWRIVDNKREPFNDGSMQGLKANTNEAEADAGSRGLDFLSNGFKIRTTDPDSNASGGNYIYMAFAEHPFVSSEGVPCTAR